MVAFQQAEYLPVRVPGQPLDPDWEDDWGWMGRVPARSEYPWQEWGPGQVLRLEGRDGLRERDQAARVDRCGRAYLEMHDRHGGAARRRVQPMRCGQRRCEDCAEEARKRARKRVACRKALEEYAPGGPGIVCRWRIFVTLTIPRGPTVVSRGRVLNRHLGDPWSMYSPEYAWRSVGKWVSRWWGIVKGALRRGWCKKGWQGKKDARAQQAWAIEAHPGSPAWPHVHVVMSMPPPSGASWRALQARMRAAWYKVVGVEWANVDIQKAKHPESPRASGYLTKYICKQEEWSPAHWAILYRRRLWGTTLPRVPDDMPPPPEWQVVECLSMAAASRRVETWVLDGWRIEGLANGAVVASPGDGPVIWDPEMREQLQGEARERAWDAMAWWRGRLEVLKDLDAAAARGGSGSPG